MVQLISSDNGCSVCGLVGDDVESCDSCSAPICTDCSEERWPYIYCSEDCMSS